jgi:hypothetical protein
MPRNVCGILDFFVPRLDGVVGLLVIQEHESAILTPEDRAVDAVLD